jgi:ubiquitin
MKSDQVGDEFIKEKGHSCPYKGTVNRSAAEMTDLSNFSMSAIPNRDLASLHLVTHPHPWRL